MNTILTPTKAQIHAYVAAIRAIADAIKEVASVPAGLLYATVMGQMSLQTFNGMVDHLEISGLIKRDRSNMLVWIGQQ